MNTSTNTMIEGFTPYAGDHCETNAIGNLLQHAGIYLSEPMLFGLGQGLGFIYWIQRRWIFLLSGEEVNLIPLSPALQKGLD